MPPWWRPGSFGHGAVGAVVKDMLNGLAIVWCYAAIRPRFGAGPRTAAYASMLAWSFVLAFIAVVYSFWMMSIGLTCIIAITCLIQFLAKCVFSRDQLKSASVG